MSTNLQRRHFLRGAGALTEYGLGRPFGFTDEDLVNEILAAAKDEQYAASAFIHPLVQSQTFRRR